MNREKFNKIYQEERDKLSFLPDMDDDFLALDNTIERYNKENEEQITWREIYYS